MIKIMYLCENLKIGGAEQLLLTTLKYLNRNKFNPVVYCLEQKGEIACEIEHMGIEVRSLDRRPRPWRMGIIIELVRILKKESPQILHTHLFYASYFGRIAAILSRKNPIIIVTEHGTKSSFKKFYHNLIDFLLSFSTTKIIAVSKAVKEYIVKSSLITTNKIIIIYNGVDFDRFDSIAELDKVSARKQIGISESGILIGCVSNLAPWKGQMCLLEAFKEIIKVFPSAKLCIVGRDAAGFQKDLEAYAREHNLLKDIYFLGERRDIPCILKALDVFVFPSFTEGLGISLLEAMYMGLPVVATRVEGIPEVIEEGQNGILVSAGDALGIAKMVLTLLEDARERQKICYNAKQKILKQFSPYEYINRLEMCYQL